KEREGMKDSVKHKDGVRKLLAQYFEKQTDPNAMGQAVQVALQMDMKELAPMALKAATAKNQQAWTRATALIAVGKFGTKDDIKQIEPLLEDKTSVGTTQFNQVQITTGVRDAAWGAMIMLSGFDYINYTSPSRRAVPNVNRQYIGYYFFGFSDNDQRAAALKQYREEVAA